MSSPPTPPIKDFYYIDGEIRYDKVYEYLNSLFGMGRVPLSTPTWGVGNSSRVVFRMPSLAVPAIFEQPPERFSINENNLDPKIRPFTLYYLFNEERRHSGIGQSNGFIFDSGGKFIFIVPENNARPNSKVVIFSRQSSKAFLRGEDRFTWTTSTTLLPSRFRNLKDSSIATMMVGKSFLSYKALNIINPMSRTLNYSKWGFQT